MRRSGFEVGMHGEGDFFSCNYSWASGAFSLDCAGSVNDTQNSTTQVLRILFFLGPVTP
jgi:hypothetical protein